VHPRLGRLLLEGQRLGQPGRAALAAALLSERDPFSREDNAPAGTTRSDTLDRVEALEAFERHAAAHGPGALNRGAARSVLRARDHLRRALRDGAGSESADTAASADDALLRALLAASPDRVARRRGAGERRGVMVGGRGVRLAPSSGVTESELFVC